MSEIFEKGNYKTVVSLQLNKRMVQENKCTDENINENICVHTGGWSPQY